jgi:hypothetical protein
MSFVLTNAQLRADLNKLASPTGAIAITSSTNASPSVVTMSAAHGWQVGDVVAVWNHATNTALNGVRVVATVPLTTTATFTDFFTAAAVNGNGAGGATGDGARLCSGMVPGDLGDLLSNLNQIQNYVNQDTDRASESTIQSIFGQ